MPMFSTKASKICRLLNSRFWLLGVFIVYSPATFSEVGVELLHIPKSFIIRLPALFDGAQLVEQSARCQKFIQGTVDMNRATSKHPIFRYTCRDQHEKIYHLRVDGLTLHLLDDTRPSGSISFAALQAEIDQQKQRAIQQEQLKQEEIQRIQAELQELERFREAELALQKKQREEHERIQTEKNSSLLETSRRKHLWEICAVKVRALTSNMQKLQWLTLDQPEPDWENKNQLHYSMDFNATDYQGRNLHYRAFCQLGSDADVNVSIHPRALAHTPQAPEDSKNP